MALQKPLPADEGWKELHGPELIKWDKPGEQIAGVLTRIESIPINGKRVPEYTLQFGDTRLKFLGTFDIVQQLGPEYRGCAVRIKYLGEDESVRGGPNNSPMKRFSIQVKGTPTQNVHGVDVTDEDVPF